MLFATLSIVAIYILARELYDHRVGLIASTLLAISQLGVMQAHEARPYALFLFLSLVTVYFFVVALRQQRASFWMGFVVAGIATLYTHYYGALLWCALILFAAVTQQRYRVPFLWWAGAVISTVVCYLPWLATGVIGAALHSPKLQAAASNSFLVTHWFSFFSSLNWFNNGRLTGIDSSPPWWAFLVGGALFGLPLLLASWTTLRALGTRTSGDRRAGEATLLLHILWVTPLATVLILGWQFHVQFSVRYVAFCVAPYYILVARGLSELTRFWRGVVLTVIFGYSLWALRSNYFIP